jgi:hypothetical protein
MYAAQWLQAVQSSVQRHFPTARVHVQILRQTRVKVRIEISEHAFIDLFFREETGRVDYSLIMNSARCYGLDNLGGWHEHPVSQPDMHQPISAPTPEEALFRVRRAIETLDAP